MTVAERGQLLVGAGLLGDRVAARESEWTALVAAVGGAFIRSQYEAWASVDRRAAHDLVRRLSAARLGGEVDGGRGVGRFIHLRARSLYRALGMGDSRHRRRGSTGHLLQRLIALDYLVGRGDDAAWLLGCDEQLGAFRGLGAPDEVIPRRTYRAPSGDDAVAYFPARWPIALGGGEALFVFPDSGEAARPALELRTWGRQHARLWDWLRRNGARVEVAFACRTGAREKAVRAELQRWVDSGVPPKGGGGAEAGDPAAEIQRIDSLFQGARIAEVEQEYGSIGGALRRKKTLQQPSPGAQPRARVHVAGTWLSGRLQGRVLAPALPLDEADFDVVPVAGVGVGD